MTQAQRPLDSSFDSSDVLANAGWVRALARSLLRSDPATADDLAQEVCLAALDRPALSGGALAGWLAGSFEKTDADGRFRLRGLLEREYQLSAMDPDTLQRIDAGSFPAGSEGVLIRFPHAEDRALVGRVVSASGAPVHGVSVVPRCDVITARLDEHSWSTVHGQIRAAVTGADGRFELHRIPERGVYLALESETSLPTEVGRNEPGGIRALAKGHDGELVIQVELQRHLQVELAAGELVDELSVLDEAGERMRIHAFQGIARFESDAYPLREGRSDVLVVSERARTLVLSRLGAEVKRVPLVLVDDVLNVVRP